MSRYKVEVKLSRYQASLKTEQKILETLAVNKEFCQYDFPKQVKKDYHTVLRHLKNLEDMKLIELLRETPSAKKGKEKKIYGITSLGIIRVLAHADAAFIPSNIDVIAEKHKEKFIIFKKWEYFQSKGLRDSMIFLLKLYFKNVLFPSNTEFDALTLGLYQLYIEHEIQEPYRHHFYAIWKACKEDSELSDFVTQTLDSYIKEEEKKTENAKEGKTFFTSL